MGRIRIDGVYDLRTLHLLKDIEIKDLGFDFRPLSFNFLQQHKFMDFVEVLKGSNTLKDFMLYCHFCEESVDVINKIKNDYLELYPKEQLKLEFSDFRPAEFYRQLDHDFIWHYKAEFGVLDILKAPNLRGIVLDYHFLHQLHLDGVFDAFFNHFMQQVLPKLKTPGFQLILKCDWDSDLFPSLFDFVDFQMISLAINSKIEICYRNVDTSKASENIHFYKQLSF